LKKNCQKEKLNWEETFFIIGERTLKEKGINPNYRKREGK